MGGAEISSGLWRLRSGERTVDMLGGGEGAVLKQGRMVLAGAGGRGEVAGDEVGVTVVGGFSSTL